MGLTCSTARRSTRSWWGLVAPALISLALGVGIWLQALSSPPLRAEAPAPIELMAVKVPDPLVERYVRVNLEADPFVEAYKIEVTVKDGIVILEGKLNCVEEVEWAEKIARETRGAIGVINHLKSSGNSCVEHYSDLLRPSPLLTGRTSKGGEKE